jgi:hypothetical protein
MANVGVLGELEVELRLVLQGWHPVRLDTGRMASNADLLAINREHRVSIQVKTTSGERHSHAHSLMFVYSTGYLRDGDSIFNAKRSPIIADVVIGVSYLGQEKSRFVVMPIAFVEILCRLHCNYWFAVPRQSGDKRSPSFPIYINFSGAPGSHKEFNERMKRNLLAFENRWDVLLQPLSQLHNEKAWPIID